MCCSGGYSETYAALCDFNEMPLREEIQWVRLRVKKTRISRLGAANEHDANVLSQNVDDVYNMDEHRRFNLLDFRHLEER